MNLSTFLSRSQANSILFVIFNPKVLDLLRPIKGFWNRFLERFLYRVASFVAMWLPIHGRPMTRSSTYFKPTSSPATTFAEWTKLMICVSEV